MSKSIKLVATLILVALCMPLAVASSREVGKYLGVVPVSVPVIGTGSMYPSLFWETGEGGPDDASQKVVEEYRTSPHMYRRFPGFSFLGRIYLYRDIGLGDMVTFQSDKTRKILEEENQDGNVGFIKRVVALPGDSVELRDGYLYRNSKLADEPYIYRPRSTYGDSTLKDCQILTVPAGKYVVMGDNRKVSSDSRGELGLVKDSDITFTLPYAEQVLYRSLWRDTSEDLELAGHPTLDSQEFYRLVNTARVSRNLPPLTPRPALANSASYKASAILAGDSDYSLANSLARANYHNIVTSEFSVSGRFTAQELLDNLLYFHDSAAQILDERYDDIGVVALNQAVDGCPTEVVVGHLGGYLPADYDQDTLDGWKELRNNLESVIPSWEQALGHPQLDQDKLTELLSLMRTRLALAREVIGVMEAREWLSPSQEERIEQDQANANRVSALVRELNGE
jgi:signal peptidase I